VPSTKYSLSVSFPQKAEYLLKDVGKVTSKDVEDEEEMFEDREAGSLPLVKVPNTAPSAAWTPAPPPPPGTRYKGYFSTMPPLPEEIFEEVSQNHKEILLSVRLPGMTSAKKKTIAKKTSTHPHKGRNISKNMTRGKGGKPRETSATHHNAKSHSNASLSNGNVNSPNANPSKSNFSQGGAWRTTRTPSGTAAH